MRRALVLLALWLGTSAAQADTRVALVIGNGQYASAGRLENPVRDAAAIAQALREVGFTSVQVEQNLTREGLIEALRRFEQQADTADWALVYYAGHGIEVSGTNYLVPVDAKLRSDRDVSEEAVSLDQLLARLEGARKLRLVILDACRDNPFLASMKRTMASRSSATRGLSRIEPDVGTLVAFAAKAGQVAKDGGQNQTNSPYATALIKNLATPDLEVDFFFRQVRADVLKATGREQDPATYGQLPAERFIFRPAPSSSAQVAALPPVVPAPVVPPAPTVISQRAELIEEVSGAENAQPTTTPGRVTWRLDAVNGEQGQPLQNALVARITIPDAGLALVMTIQRNLDTTLPASHTVSLVFSQTENGPARTVQDVGLLQAKDEQNARGSPVSGLPVRVRDNLFLIGLSSLPNDIERNTDLLLHRNWFDLALRYTSGKRAVLTFEKGSAGAQVMQSAFSTWQ